ncbi:Acyl transferase/acyl hydrolase/lysophospholipase [Penicillium expansum]|uniref:Acyl transferase/acyl hydrolase/lysophospholipase n=1 Tax=Penicillium expansum TaxID=27334 RepID=A0A0A2I841_PENEN|nr:Acyl transferase/acyl hydrolase/lysophospholipase [Penicillium expansum]KGO38588.1 Acyl transferase/acyl hydrolase/lysophospholipase [Penicillium expansum]KGO59507.1 Acyl transferase/acyl hydrolase/lysophospholipase [Penicillium expansum]
MMATESSVLYLFGDQIADVLPCIQELSQRAANSDELRRFLRSATDSLRKAIYQASFRERQRFPTWESLTDLATAVERDDAHCPALKAALCCISQLGHVILYLEKFPRALEFGSSSKPGRDAVLGLCTGSIAASVFSCSRNITELHRIAHHAVALAFQLGLEASRRSEYINSSKDTRTRGSWATLVSNVAVEEIREALASFNAQMPSKSGRRAYISAQSTSSVTISGPPSYTAELLQKEPVFHGRKTIPLPIAAAFHAEHLDPVPWKKISQACSNAPFETFKPNMPLISPSSGLPYAADNLSALLIQVVDDILQQPIILEEAVKGVASLASSSISLLSFGATSSKKTIMNSLNSTAGIEVDDKSKAAFENSMKEPDTENAIAIVGMSVRLPGSETLEEFWKVLEQGRDLHEKIRPDRFDVDTHCDPTGKAKNTTLTPYGVFIDRPGYFDTRLFNMSPREAAQTDPQQRMLLLTTYEALEMAGYTPNGSPSTNTRRIGSWMGQTSDDWREVNASQNVDTYFITGGIRAFGPGRLNYHFGWEGPSYSLDTACSSSAASIQLACSALLAGECDTAVGGGANFLTASDLFAGLSRGSFLSKTGGCKTFDHDADGYVRADAVGVVVMKRLSDAVAERDNILAVIRGTTTNHSAEAVSITHPHAETQERLFTTVLNKAGVQPHNVDYAELHGTGTQAGDATESRSVTNVLARGRTASNPLYIGTVKPNLGHGEAGSGVTSLIKAIMMLRKNMIPPHIGIKGRINQKLPPLAELNTHISFEKTPFLPRADGDGKRRILINNFDAAGGNTSMLIEDPPARPATTDSDPRSHHMVAVSAKTPTSATNNVRQLLAYLKQNPGVRLQDISYTTTARRMHYNIRRAIVASSVDDLVAKLEKQSADGSQWAKPNNSRPLVFTFTGQGSLRAGMAKDLYTTQPSFRETILDCDRISTAHGFPSFLPIIIDPTMSAKSASPVQAQLSIVAVELALAELWRSMGAVPTAVIGHSLGEYAALCVAGVFSVSDCLYLVGTRASLMLEKCRAGSHSMLAVQDTERNLEDTLSYNSTLSECEIACVNGLTSTVVSGPIDQIASLHEALQAEKKKSTQLEVQYAFHSAQMEPLLDDLVSVAEKIHFSTPSIPFASTQLGTVVTTGGIIDSQYLKRQTRQRVQFTKAVQALESLHAGNRASPVWIEIGPSPLCLGMIRNIAGKDQVLLPSLKRDEDDWKTISESIALAYDAGVDIDWREVHRPYELNLNLLELPNYAFDLKNYWLQYEGDWAIRKGASSGTTPAPTKSLLPTFSTSGLHRIESLVRDDDTGISVTFASDAAEPKLNKALRGHLVNGAGLCPSSVYADMAFTAARYIQSVLDPSTPVAPLDVRDMEVHKPLLIQPGATKQIIRVTATLVPSSQSIDVKFSSEDGGSHQDHAHCRVDRGEGDVWKSEWARTSYLVKSRMNQLIKDSSSGDVHKVLRPMVYKLFAALVDYDDKYQGLQEVYMDSDLLEATAKVRFRTTPEDGTFTYSPYWIDSLAHLSGFVLNGADTTPADSVYISHGWKSMKIVGELSEKKDYQSYVRMQQTKTKGVLSGDVFFLEDGEVVAVCQELKFQRIKRTILDHLMPRNPATTPAVVERKPVYTVQQRSKPVIKTKTVTSTPDNSNVLQIIASEVGVDVSELTDDVMFADLGVDSLLTISIIARLSSELNQEIPSSLFMNYPSVRELCGHLSASTETAPVPSSDSSDSGGDRSSSEEDTRPDSPITEAASPASGGVSSTDHIRKIIANELEIDVAEIDEHIPLAELGVDSLLSISIISTIKAQTGRVLPSSFLIDHPTLAEIEVALDGRRAAPAVSPPQLAKALEKIQDGPSSSPSKYKAEAVLLQGSPSSSHGASLFILPDGSGSAGSYVGLPSLNAPGPVYGLNSPFLKSPSSFSCSIPEVAAMYIREIQRIQPHGPYRLAGWSIGGSFAFEAASQLIQKHDETIESLVLIDAPCPSVYPPLPIETVDLLETIGAFDGLKNDNRNGLTPSKQSSIPQRVREHFIGSIKALKAYEPKAIPSSSQGPKSVTALWAQNGVWETVGEEKKSQFQELTRIRGNQAEDWILDPRGNAGPNGWDSLVPGVVVRCAVIPGDHFTMMRRPGVNELGAKLAETLQ